ncbi:MAG TPA: CBS domain-containing protein [Terriglobia bacterium]|nr:CBS domain-containing protein [Terriglobia bacterium]
MKVAELIANRTDVFTLPESCTVLDAARYLRDKRTRAVGIVSEQGKLVGVVSQSDISDKVAAENKCPAWTKVSEIMSTGLESVRLDTTLDECLRAMEKRGIFHLLVMDEKAGYRGILSVSDLLAAIVSDQKARADMLEAFMFGQQ